MRTERFCLGLVLPGAARNMEIVPCIPELSLTRTEYSRFKYGDTRPARAYGEAMARHLLPRLLAVTGGDICVTSSAYRAAPPASASLLTPFLHAAQAFIGLTPTPFKVHRSRPTDGDYATLDTTARRRVMRETAFSLPAGVELRGKHIVALDDIRVTGAHETALNQLFSAHAARGVTHIHILEAACDECSPTLEASLNDVAVADIDDLIALARSADFALNARFGKRILTETPEILRKFIRSVPAGLVQRLLEDAAGDGLDGMERYRSGFAALVKEYSGTR
jgi:hypothetical protein